MVTPDGWKNVHLGDAARLVAGINKPLSAMGRGTLYLTVQELYVGSAVDPDQLGRIDLSPDEIVRFSLQPGDIVFGKSSVKREGIGYPNRFVGAREPVVHSGFTYAARPVPEVAHADFLFHALRSSPTRKWLINNSQASALTNINAQIAKAIPIFLPPLTEQEAIAEALGDADAAIETLNALIAKKRDVKKAAMQQVFSPKQLEDHAATVIRFDQDITMKARIGWQGLTTAEYRSTGLYKLVTGTDITGGAIQWDTCWHVEEDRYSQDKNIQLRVDDVLVTKDGTIGKVGYVQSLPQPATLNSGVFVLRPKSDKVDPRYLRHLMMSRVFREFLDRLAAGSTISHLYQKDFVRFEAVVPNIADQKRIAELLTNMDTDVEALVAQRDKMRLVKQGMMQELLSGRVRLV